MTVSRNHGWSRLRPLSVVLVLMVGTAHAAGDNKWQIAVEGQSELNGKVVMRTQLGKLEKFNLIGGSQSMITIEVHADLPGEPYLAQIIYLETDTICTRGVSGMAPTDEVGLSREGGKYVISGQIKCRHKDGGEPSTRPISGWFMQ